MREVAYFAGRCFWDFEYFFRKAGGVVSTGASYMSGHKEKPTYEEVCDGTIMGKTGKPHCHFYTKRFK